MPTWRFRNPLTAKFPIITWIAGATLLLYLLFCAAALWAFIIPAVNGDSPIRIGADSSTYWVFADDLTQGNGVALLTFSGNLVGPVAIAFLLKSPAMVALLNLVLFGLSIRIAGKVPGVNKWVFALLLMLNAETAVSLISLNKEIFTLISMVLLVRYIHSERRSKSMLLAILGLSLAARWEQAMIIVMFLIMYRGRFRRHPGTALAIVTLGITVAYPLAGRGVDLSEFTDQAAGGGMIVVLNSIQSHFGFFIAMIPKIFMSLAGTLSSPWYFLDGYWALPSWDWQQRYAMLLHESAILTLIVWAIWRKRLSLREPVPFFIALYLIVTAASPFIQPRYQYPVYVLLCLQMAVQRIHYPFKKPLSTNSLQPAMP